MLVHPDLVLVLTPLVSTRSLRGSPIRVSLYCDHAPSSPSGTHLVWQSQEVNILTATYVAREANLELTPSRESKSSGCLKLRITLPVASTQPSALLAPPRFETGLVIKGKFPPEWNRMIITVERILRFGSGFHEVSRRWSSIINVSWSSSAVAVHRHIQSSYSSHSYDDEGGGDFARYWLMGADLCGVYSSCRP